MRKKDIWFTMACRGRKELWGSDFEINKGQAAFFFERRETAKSSPCALMDETQKGHLTFPRETNLSALWTRQLMCLETNYIFFFLHLNRFQGASTLKPLPAWSGLVRTEALPAPYLCTPSALHGEDLLPLPLCLKPTYALGPL